MSIGAKLPEFERRYGVTVDVQVVEQNALRNRLLAAFAAGTPCPTWWRSLRTPPCSCGADPRHRAPRHHKMGKVKDLEDKMVATRFSMWQRKGVIFALPHDVHPMMLAYRADIVEDQLGIDVSKIVTWGDFAAMARKIVRYGDDGRPARYALEFQNDGGYLLQALLLQRDVGLFDADGHVTFDSDVAVDTFVWAIRQLRGRSVSPTASASGPHSGRECRTDWCCSISCRIGGPVRSRSMPLRSRER